MNNTLQMINGKFVLNGAPVHNVTSYKLEPISGGCATEVTLTFDVPSSKPKAVNAKAEQTEEPHLNITIGGEIPEIKKKSLYREFLGKQLGFLEYAQEDARSNGAFEEALAYSYKILELSREIEELDNRETVGASVDQSPIHQPEASTHQPETKLDLVKLIRFAIEGVRISKLQLQASDHARWTYKATREKELNDYKDELEREYSRLTNGEA